jgi:Secretion system C-terminal sorting domain
MKLKRCILPLLLLFTPSLKSQTYHSIIQDSANWLVNYIDWTHTFDDYTVGYQMLGDTTIDTFTYKKIYKLWLEQNAPPYTIGSSVIYGAIREDSQRVYAINFYEPLIDCPLGTDFLLFDFNYLVGDTVNLCVNYEYPDIVTSITPSTQFIPDNSRWSTSSNCEYFDGVGSARGLFEVDIIFGGPNLYPYLTDYCVGDFLTCFNPVLTRDEPFSSNSIQVWPNPSRDFITAELSNLQTVNEIIMVDVLGKTAVCNWKQEGLEIQINFEATPGIYFLEITFSGGKKGYQKMWVY